MSDANALVVQHMLDREQVIADLRAENATLRSRIEQLETEQTTEQEHRP